MMMCRRLFNGPPITVIVAAFFIILFIHQAKDLYEKNQKQHRMENYSQFISEVSSSVSALEAAANKSSGALHQLTDMLQRLNRKPQPPSTLS